MNRIRDKIGVPKPGVVLGVIGIVIALTGTAIAAQLSIDQFDTSSKDRLAGTGVIQYAANAQNTGTGVTQVPNTNPPEFTPVLKTFTVQCELSKKATSGGFKWTGTPPPPNSYRFLDAYPNGGGFVVRIYLTTPAAENQPISVYSNCVKSRTQRGSPPA